jgi:hypothetical protein
VHWLLTEFEGEHAAWKKEQVEVADEFNILRTMRLCSPKSTTKSGKPTQLSAACACTCGLATSSNGVVR